MRQLCLCAGNVAGAVVTARCAGVLRIVSVREARLHNSAASATGEVQSARRTDQKDPRQVVGPSAAAVGNDRARVGVQGKSPRNAVAAVPFPGWRRAWRSACMEEAKPQETNWTHCMMRPRSRSRMCCGTLGSRMQPW